MGLTSNQLTRVEIDNQAATDEIELTKSVEDSLFAMYLDPTGRHLIISMTSTDNMYIARGSKKLRPLTKLKGHRITAVGWNRHSTTEQSTGEILIGTSKGFILETMISSVEESRLFTASVDQYVKHVFTLAKEKSYPVSAVEFDRIPSGSTTDQRYFVLATMSGRLYQFIGIVPSGTEQPIFTHVFSNYEQTAERFLELPGSLTSSQLQLYYPKMKAIPKSFAWMTGAGVYCGQIDVTGQAGHDTVTVDTKLIQYKKEESAKSSLPISMALTEFHLLVLFPNKVKGICCLNEQVVYTDEFKDAAKSGGLLGMCRDPANGIIWAYNARSVYRFRVVREAREVWPMYLEKNEFELARKYCQESQGDMNRILVKEAEHLFDNKKYTESARIYADTLCSFEEVTLKFVSLDDKRPLKQFLINKLSNVRPQDKTQMTMIVVWLTELWLNELGQLKESGVQLSAQYEQVQESFRKFLNMARVKECVTNNRNTVYQLISSHGDVEDMIFFACLIQDYERVISHHIQQENYLSALEVLSRQVTLFIYLFTYLQFHTTPNTQVITLTRLQ